MSLEGGGTKLEDLERTHPKRPLPLPQLELGPSPGPGLGPGTGLATVTGLCPGPCHSFMSRVTFMLG